MSAVEHPSHYCMSNIECIDAIESALGSSDRIEGFLQGNALKYIWRFRHKGKPIEDLQKAEWYLRRLIDRIQVEEEEHQNTNTTVKCTPGVKLNATLPHTSHNR